MRNGPGGDHAKEAANQGHMEAQAHCGTLYNFEWGVAKDDRLAFEYYEKAAQLEDAGSQINVGVCFRAGQGCGQSYERAVKFQLCTERIVIRSQALARVVVPFLSTARRLARSDQISLSLPSPPRHHVLTRFASSQSKPASDGNTFKNEKKKILQGRVCTVLWLSHKLALGPYSI